jgi:serine/threonine-protein kinase SRPK3
MAHQDGLLLELEIMKAITGLKRPPPLPYLIDHFETDGPHGQHLCIVQPVLSTDISRFRRSAPSKRLGFPAVKIIIAQVLQALVALHAARIIHTGK